MLFSSITFLYYFLPLVLLLYFIVPKCMKNTLLFVSSLVFYGWGEPRYVFLMLISITFGYAFAFLIDKHRGTYLSKVFTAISVIITLSFLLYLKYANFFLDNFVNVFTTNKFVLNIVLPIGISFYTFQILSYTIDLYRGKIALQKNPISLATYITLFPQLIAGPIVRYKDVEKELSYRTHSVDKVSLGIKRFVKGLSKKIIIANTLGELCALFNDFSEKTVVFYWVYIISYALQIYFDFSGYSDIAIGLGKMFGFNFCENFNYPFIASSITDFWRRWHMSLGTWFRDYVYIPLGGSRCSKKRLLFNILVVWFLTGFWHGANWNFILWGLYFAVLLSIEKLFLLKFFEKRKILSHIYTTFIVLMSFVFISYEDLGIIADTFKGLFGFGNIAFINADSLYYIKSYLFVIILGIIFATPIIKIILGKLENHKKLKYIIYALEAPLIILGLIVCTSFLIDGSFNPFLYFRF